MQDSVESKRSQYKMSGDFANHGTNGKRFEVLLKNKFDSQLRYTQKLTKVSLDYFYFIIQQMRGFEP